MHTSGSEDSRTNVMIDFWFGKGDCRQHAFVKQLLYDVWEAKQAEILMGEAYDAVKKSDQETFKQKKEAIRTIQKRYMFVFDSVIHAPIKMHRKYDPLYDMSGSFYIRDETLNPIEDHTWNGIVYLDDSDRIDMTRWDPSNAESPLMLVDSFYHHQYALGGNRQLPNGERCAGIPADPREVMQKGIYGGKLDVVDDMTDEEGDASFYVSPTSYAGNRNKRLRKNKYDLGDRPFFRGVVLARDDDNHAAFLGDTRELRETWATLVGKRT